MKGWKKSVSILLVLSVLAGIILVYGNANNVEASVDKMIMAGASGIDGTQVDSVYYGTYLQSSDGTALGYNDDPIKWRVLSNNSEQLFVLADQNLDSKPYYSSQTDVTWAESTLREWLNSTAEGDFIAEAFDKIEREAIADTTVVTADNGYVDAVVNAEPKNVHIHGEVEGGPVEGGEDTTDKVFLLSIEEASNGDYFPSVTGDDETSDEGNQSRIATNTAYTASKRETSPAGEADIWRLRSPGTLTSRTATVRMNGKVDVHGRSVDLSIYPVRPAMNLDLSDVLFTSAAEGGKAGMDGALTSLKEKTYNGNEWKATIIDETRSQFTASVTSRTDDTITVSYSNAKTGANEYLSAVVVDHNGAYTHYGRIKKLAEDTDASGTVNITITDIDLTGKTVWVFNEQYNGGEEDNTKLTDYASALVNVGAIETFTWSAFANAKDQAFVKGAFDNDCYTVSLADEDDNTLNAKAFEAKVTFTASGDYLCYGAANGDEGLKVGVTEDGKLSIPDLELTVEPSVIGADTFIKQEFTLGIIAQSAGSYTVFSIAVNDTLYTVNANMQLSADSITVAVAKKGILIRSVTGKTEVLYEMTDTAYSELEDVSKVMKNGTEITFDSDLSVAGDYILLDSDDKELRTVIVYQAGDTHPDGETDVRDLVAMKKVQEGVALTSWSGTMGACGADFSETDIIETLLQ